MGEDDGEKEGGREEGEDGEGVGKMHCIDKGTKWKVIFYLRTRLSTHQTSGNETGGTSDILFSIGGD